MIKHSLSAFWGKGKVGVYADKDGKMAYRLFCFENKKVTDFEYDKEIISINCFFNGVELPTNFDFKTLEIIKILPDKSEMKIDYSVSGNILYFQPQTKGKYRILMNEIPIKPTCIISIHQVDYFMN